MVSIIIKMRKELSNALLVGILTSIADVSVCIAIDQFRYIKIYTWLRGLANKQNKFYSPKPRSQA